MYFTPDAVYEIEVDAGERVESPPPVEHRGRRAVLAYLEHVTSAFDKRLASRRLVPFAPPREVHGSVWLYGAAVYTMPDGAR